MLMGNCHFPTLDINKRINTIFAKVKKSSGPLSFVVAVHPSRFGYSRSLARSVLFVWDCLCVRKSEKKNKTINTNTKQKQQQPAKLSEMK